MRAVAHQATKEAVESELEALRNDVQRQDPKVLGELRELWSVETQRVDPTVFGNLPVFIEEVLNELPQTLEAVHVLMDNYLSGERLKYTKEKAETVIVVGGNTLSRGLTLEGLISSYFVRAASAYDTLLQMGRWFGYRKGYEDLVRVWMTAELREWFVALATVEVEIREEIDRYAKEGKKPSQLPVRIRSHPQMTITAAAKMRSAIKVNVSFSGTKVQTILFKDEDKTWLDANIAATTALVSAARAAGHTEDELPSKNVRGFSGITNDAILDFLSHYEVHEDARTIRTDTVREYIRAQADKGALDSWNVVFIERQKMSESDLTLGLDKPLKLLRRRKMASGVKSGVANLKAISSRWDRFADLEYSKKSIVDSHGLSHESQVRDYLLRDLRNKRGLDKVGLLAIYPINKDSEDERAEKAALDTGDPKESKSERVPLKAANHMIGIALMFPEARDLSDTVDYFSANVDPEDVEDIEAELAAADDLDEKHAVQEEAATK